MSQKIPSPIGFSDSELSGYTRRGSSIVVEVRAWNGKCVQVSFSEVIGLRDLLAGDFSDLVLDAPWSGTILEDCLRRQYESRPASHPFKVYSFLNLVEEPALDVVATACEVKVT